MSIETELAARILACDNQLDELFSGIQLSAELSAQLLSVKNYYRTLYSLGRSERESSVRQYELFVEILQNQKSGEYTNEYVNSELDSLKSSQKQSVLYVDLLNTLGLLFWLGLAGGAIAANVLIDPGTFEGHEVLGGFTIAATIILVILTGVSSAQCIKNLKSVKFIDEEYARDKDLFSFFGATAIAKPKPVEPSTPEIELAEVVCN